MTTRPVRVFRIIGLTAISSLLLAGIAYATILGTTSSTFTVDTGNFTVSLNSETPSVGLTVALNKMITDVTYYRYINIQNDGSIAGEGMSMWATASSSGSNSELLAAATGLQIGIAECSQPWTWTSTTSSCGGTETPLLAGSTTLATLITKTQASPQVLSMDPLTTSVGSNRKLRITFKLPLIANDSNTSGTPSAGSTQGQTTNLVLNFAMTQVSVSPSSS